MSKPAGGFLKSPLPDSNRPPLTYHSSAEAASSSSRHLRLELTDPNLNTGRAAVCGPTRRRVVSGRAGLGRRHSLLFGKESANDLGTGCGT